MFSFFKNQQDKGHQASQPAIDAPSTRSAATSTPAHLRHIELIRVVLRENLRLSGIPTDWIGCEVIPRMMKDRRTPAHLVNLVVLKWNDELIKYLPAFQQQLMHHLQRFDPATDHSHHVVSWLFAPDCGCPYTALPPPVTWSRTSHRSKFDLPPSENDRRAQGNDFAPTEPTPLR